MNDIPDNVTWLITLVILCVTVLAAMGLVFWSRRR